MTVIAQQGDNIHLIAQRTVVACPGVPADVERATSQA